MRILGIDPGLAIVGFGVIDVSGNQIRVVSYGTITSEAHTPTGRRLHLIYEDMTALLERYAPDEVAMEELFFAKNVTTGIHVAQARGVEILAVTNRQIPLYEYTPMQVKQAVTGFGRASKGQVQEMVRMMLHLQEIPKPDDAADGLAIALTHAHSQGFKEQFRMD